MEDAIDRALKKVLKEEISEVFNLDILKIIEFQMEKHGINMDRIGEDADKLEKILYKLFGNASYSLIHSMCNKLYNEFDLINFNGISSLSECINDIRVKLSLNI